MSADDDLMKWLSVVLDDDERVARVASAVLADIAAKREIMRERNDLFRVIRIFASAYADRPGYRQEWAP